MCNSQIWSLEECDFCSECCREYSPKLYASFQLYKKSAIKPMRLLPDFSLAIHRLSGTLISKFDPEIFFGSWRVLAAWITLPSKQASLPAAPAPPNMQAQVEVDELCSRGKPSEHAGTSCFQMGERAIHTTQGY